MRSRRRSAWQLARWRAPAHRPPSTRLSWCVLHAVCTACMRDVLLYRGILACSCRGAVGCRSCLATLPKQNVLFADNDAGAHAASSLPGEHVPRHCRLRGEGAGAGECSTQCIPSALASYQPSLVWCCCRMLLRCAHLPALSMPCNRRAGEPSTAAWCLPCWASCHMLAWTSPFSSCSRSACWTR